MNRVFAKIYLVLLSAFQPLYLFAEPRGRYYPDTPDIGLPSGNEVGIGLIIAIIAIPIGYLFLNTREKEKSSDVGFGGCIGLILIGAGIICLLPLVAWLCAIGSVIMGIGIAVFVVIAILALIFGKHN